MTTSPTTPQAKSTRELHGIVARRSGDKTIAVKVNRVKVHPVYHKRSTVTTTYLVHDEANVAQVGQEVTIRQSRPLSRRKRWILVSSPDIKSAS